MKTIKILLLAAFFISATSVVRAQGIGIRGGANISNISNGYYSSSDNFTGMYVGVYKEIPLLKKLLYLQPEIQYSQQGFSVPTSDIKIDYITVPVLAKLYLVKMLSFESGPQFGFKISDKTDGPVNPDFKTFDTSWAFGMGLELPLGLSISGRYITSFSEVINNTGAKNQVFQIGAGFKF